MQLKKGIFHFLKLTVATQGKANVHPSARTKWLQCFPQSLAHLPVLDITPCSVQYFHSKMFQISKGLSTLLPSQECQWSRMQAVGKWKC